VPVEPPIKDARKDTLFLGMCVAMKTDNGLVQKHSVRIVESLMQAWQAQGLFGLTVSGNKVLCHGALLNVVLR
jgi:hypothetical protein